MAKNKAAGPLSGKRVLVGRARHQAGALSSELRKLGAQVVEIPFIEIRTPRSFKRLDSALKKLDEYEWLILTSVNGVEAMWARVQKLRLSAAIKKLVRSGALRIAAIGPATQKSIEKKGLRVDVVPPEYVAESVVQSMRSHVEGKWVLLVRAKVARDVIPRELRHAGAQVDVMEAYETVVPRSSRLRLRSAIKNSQRRPDAITFTSSSTVKNFKALLGSAAENHLRGILLASIGPVTSATLRDLGFRVDVEAREFTIPGLVEALTSSLSKQAEAHRSLR